MRIGVEGVNYNVEVGGSGAPLVLLHGFTGSAETWNSLIDSLDGEFLTVAIDFLGHGKSESPRDATRYVMEQCVADLGLILDELKIAKASVLGYSMGGRVALQLAYKHPERVSKLILESASPGIKDEEEQSARAASDDRLADMIERDGVEKFAEYWSNIPLFATQARMPSEVRERLKAQRLTNNAQGLANSLRGLSVGRQEALWDALPGIQMPTLLIAGELDSKYSAIAKEMAEAMPEAQVRIVKDAGHTVHLEQPYFLKRMVLEFAGKIIGELRTETGD